MLNYLRNYEICKKVPELHFLLHGPVGAGKSSIINTIKSIFENRPYHLSLPSAASGKSFTLKYHKFPIGSELSGQVPFAFYDVMGLEEGKNKGMHTDDIISALKGHIPEDYEFQPHAMIKEDKRYISDPTLRDMIHCLVSVLPADKVTLMSDSVIDKMKTVRAAASALGMPQMVFMTKVDEACPMIKDDLSKVYQSKKIKEKMHECSNRLGVPMNCIFPMKNYHEETVLNESVNLLMLEALKQIVIAANDYVEKSSK
ncbi:interferon-induced protein 44-like [Astyanax mexicanus]|uniref:interferon-induced protein 44-like n=1 Tax=Astyanax mexicanus TaxID=7994 RepID=UPI0020CAD122|nr:interferon-induced protein 44-like [Astyanax mexicanus]